MNESKNMQSENKRVAIVTGGGSGLGYAITAKFVESGIQTIAIGRDEVKLDHARKSLGENCFPIVCDLNDLQSIPAVIERIIAQFGRIDILVNNAGINMKKEFTEVTDEEF